MKGRFKKNGWHDFLQHKIFSKFGGEYIEILHSTCNNKEFAYLAIPKDFVSFLIMAILLLFRNVSIERVENGRAILYAKSH
jgi:hypothetical protein